MFMYYNTYIYIYISSFFYIEIFLSKDDIKLEWSCCCVEMELQLIEMLRALKKYTHTSAENL